MYRWTKKSVLHVGNGTLVRFGELVSEGALPEASIKAFLAKGHLEVVEKPAEKKKPKKRKRKKLEVVVDKASTVEEPKEE